MRLGSLTIGVIIGGIVLAVASILALAFDAPLGTAIGQVMPLALGACIVTGVLVSRERRAMFQARVALRPRAVYVAPRQIGRISPAESTRSRQHEAA